MSTPELHLQTVYVLNQAGRILSTREPQATAGPGFALVRSPTRCASAVRADVAEDIALELGRLAQEEPLLSNLRDEPVHMDRYQSLLEGRVHSGPAFSFPQGLPPQSPDVVVVQDEHLLQHHFRGWIEGEIAAGRAPVLAIVDGGYPVSICFSGRSSGIAAEAGLETAVGFRGRGLAAQVTSAWGMAVRTSGRVPLYSTDWSNASSLAVARKLKLEPYAAHWSVQSSTAP